MKQKKLSSVIQKENIIFLNSAAKNEALKELIENISTSPAITDKEDLEKKIFEREKLMSTGIGLGIGVPHVKIDSVKDLVISVGIAEEALKGYEALDKEPVKIVFMIATHTNQHSNYIKLLSEISRTMKNEELRQRLYACRDKNEIYNILVKGSG